jgi:ribose transport system substrate-binding protein
MSFMNRKFVLAAVGCVALMFGSVQAKSADTRQVDVGLSKPLEIDTSKKLKIAFFIGATNNAGLKAMAVGAQRKAKELGIEMDVFDANWDPSAMVNQMENALQRDYNAWVVIAPDGNAVCDIATKEAPKKNILVSINVVPVCGKNDGEGLELWVKGTVAFIGGTETPSVYWNLFEKAIADSPGEQRVGLLTGNALNPLVFNLTKVTEGIHAKHPDFKVVSKLDTNWSTPIALEKATTMFQAHPDINVIFCQYTSITHGAIAALETKGLAGKVKVYEVGATKWSVAELKKGEITGSSPTYPESNGAAGVETLAKVFAGAQIPKIILNDAGPLMPGQGPEQSTIITPQNINAYHAEIE